MSKEKKESVAEKSEPAKQAVAPIPETSAVPQIDAPAAPPPSPLKNVPLLQKNLPYVTLMTANGAYFVQDGIYFACPTGKYIDPQPELNAVPKQG